MILSTPATAQTPQGVSLIRLIATPEAFNGKLIRVIGYVRIEFEHYAIYVHREDDQFKILKNGIALDLPADVIARRTEYDGKYVLLEGTFDSTRRGHMSASSGLIGAIRRFQEWPPRR
jgi:hypothetical protein